MTILRVRFTKTLGLHREGETYLIELGELRAALAANALDLASVEIVEPQRPTPTAQQREEVKELVRLAGELAALANAPAPAVEDDLPDFEDAPTDPEATAGGDA